MLCPTLVIERFNLIDFFISKINEKMLLIQTSATKTYKFLITGKLISFNYKLYRK